MKLIIRLNQHRHIIFALFILVLVIALMLMPSLVVEAGKAPGAGG